MIVKYGYKAILWENQLSSSECVSWIYWMEIYGSFFLSSKRFNPARSDCSCALNCAVSRVHNGDNSAEQPS